MQRALASEFAGTLFLVATIVGSGIMGERLAGGIPGLALLANSIATGAVLIALIYSFGAISGAHFNPAVTLTAAFERTLAWRHVPAYIGAQVAGAIAGTFIAHAMFELPLIQTSTRMRTGPAQWLAEFVATFGLIAVIHATGKRASVVPITVGLYIMGAYWFTASTSFANPAVTIARALTNTFSGIRPVDVAPFIAAQLAGAAAATLFFRWLTKGTDR